MSEYQYYEFQALDRRLDEQQMAYVRTLSSRVQLTPYQATFTYSYGDFRGNPEVVLERCFDAMLYIANWGSKRLMLRFPKAVIDSTIIENYTTSQKIKLSHSNDYTTLDFDFGEGESQGWMEDQEEAGQLSKLVPLRDDIWRGDYRALYVAWLGAVQDEYAINDAGQADDPEEDDYYDISPTDQEPPVPPNLGKLSPALSTWVDFLGLDADLLAAAAQASVSEATVAEPIEAWIRALPHDEQIQFLIRVANGEPNVGALLTARLRALNTIPNHTEDHLSGQRRTVAQLLKEAHSLRAERLEKERNEAARKKAEKLRALAGREAQMWENIWSLVAQKQTKAYDEAIMLLKDVQELAQSRNLNDAFYAKVQSIVAKYPTLSGLRSRLQQAHLLATRR